MEAGRGLVVRLAFVTCGKDAPAQDKDCRAQSIAYLENKYYVRASYSRIPPLDRVGVER